MNDKDSPNVTMEAPESQTSQHGPRNSSEAVDESELISRSSDPLLSVKDLYTTFNTKEGTVKAADRVSFEILSGEILGIVGESGCGKTVTSLSVMDLIRPPGSIDKGDILLNGENLRGKTTSEMRDIRGDKMSMIFQEPASALNPVYDVGWQVGEPLRIHQDMEKKASRRRAIELMQEVGIPSSEERIDDYPHQFSGGMRQRAMIATALACEPELLIADEPTTSLDVTIQAQILDLIRNLNQKRGMAVMLITHDLGVVAEICDQVAVMYAGRIVEYGDVHDIFSDPRHPYTKSLMDCVPDPTDETQTLSPIEGSVPDLVNPPSGCNFAPRCPYAVEGCRSTDPRLRKNSEGHHSACIWENPQ